MSTYRTKSSYIGNYKAIIIQNNSLNSSCIGCIIKCGSTNDNKGKSGICGIVNYLLLNSENAKQNIEQALTLSMEINTHIHKLKIHQLKLKYLLKLSIQSIDNKRINIFLQNNNISLNGHIVTKYNINEYHNILKNINILQIKHYIFIFQIIN